MTNINTNQMAYNGLDFSFQTSSGDNISLSMYDRKELSTNSTNVGNMSMQEFSLTHAYGYEYHYEGNGIDENDQKEIAKALEALQPKIDEFLENVENSGIPSPREILNSSKDLRDELPEIKDNEQKMAIQNQVLKLFDDSVQKYFPNEDILKSAKALFDKLNEQLESFSLYV